MVADAARLASRSKRSLSPTQTHTSRPPTARATTCSSASPPSSPATPSSRTSPAPRSTASPSSPPGDTCKRSSTTAKSFPSSTSSISSIRSATRFLLFPRFIPDHQHRHCCRRHPRRPRRLRAPTDGVRDHRRNAPHRTRRRRPHAQARKKQHLSQLDEKADETHRREKAGSREATQDSTEDLRRRVGNRVLFGRRLVGGFAFLPFIISSKSPKTKPPSPWTPS